jgi:hypothetical protein
VAAAVEIWTFESIEQLCTIQQINLSDNNLLIIARKRSVNSQCHGRCSILVVEMPQLMFGVGGSGSKKRPATGNVSAAIGGGHFYVHLKHFRKGPRAHDETPSSKAIHPLKVLARERHRFNDEEVFASEHHCRFHDVSESVGVDKSPYLVRE